MRWLIAIGVLALLAGVMLGLSHPVELRPGRRWKMAVSLPMLALAILIMIQGAGNPAAAIGQVTTYVFLIGVPGLIWTPNITWFAARIISEVLHGSGRAGGGFRPDFSLARHYLKEGDLEEALKLTDEELDKDPCNFEGMLLLAQICLYRKEPDKAIKALEVIIANPDATDQQKELAVAEKKRLECEFSKPAGSDAAPPPLKQT
jgi:hypothetical protein